LGQRGVIDEPALRTHPGGAGGGRLGKSRCGEQGLGAAVGQVVGHLAGLQQRIHRHRDRTAEHDAVERDGEGRRVGQHHAHSIARLDTRLLQQGRDSGGRSVEFSICEFQFVTAQRNAVGVTLLRGNEIGAECGHEILREVLMVPTSRVILTASDNNVGANNTKRDPVLLATAALPGIGCRGMGVASNSRSVRHDATVDPHVVELSKLMLARAPELGKAMAERLYRDIDAYRDDNLVSKEQIAAGCVGNVAFIFDSLTGNADVDASPAERTGTERALAGMPLPAVLTAYRIGFRVMWGQPLGARRARATPTDAILEATARVFLAQETFTQAMSNAYRQQLTAQILEREEERSALVEALLSHRMTDRQSLWEAADLLRLPTSGPYVVVAAELPAIGRLGLPAIENKLSTRDIRSAWRLLPDLQVGIVHLRKPATPHTLGTLIDVLHQTATIRVGISPTFHELAETSSALRFARLAVSGKASADSLVTVFDDTPLSGAGARAPEVMAKIKSSVLGRLNELPAEERTILLDTFEAWFQAGGS